MPGCLSDSKTVSRCIAQESNEVRVRRCFAAGCARSIKGNPKRVLPAQICHLSPQSLLSYNTDCRHSLRVLAFHTAAAMQGIEAVNAFKYVLSIERLVKQTSGLRTPSMYYEIKYLAVNKAHPKYCCVHGLQCMQLSHRQHPRPYAQQQCTMSLGHDIYLLVY